MATTAVKIQPTPAHCVSSALVKLTQQFNALPKETPEMPAEIKAANKALCRTQLDIFLNKIPSTDTLALQALFFRFPVIPFHTPAAWLVILIDKICGPCNKEGEELEKHYGKMLHTYFPPQTRRARLEGLLAHATQANLVRNLYFVFEKNISDAYFAIFLDILGHEQTVHQLKNMDVWVRDEKERREIMCTLQIPELSAKQVAFAHSALPELTIEQFKQNLGNVCKAYYLTKNQYCMALRTTESTPAEKTKESGEFSKNLKKIYIKQYYNWLMNQGQGACAINIKANGTYTIGTYNDVSTVAAATAKTTSTTAATVTTSTAASASTSTSMARSTCTATPMDDAAPVPPATTFSTLTATRSNTTATPMDFTANYAPSPTMATAASILTSFTSAASSTSTVALAKRGSRNKVML